MDIIPAPTVAFNLMNPQCTVGSCLDQVAGYINNNPEVQLSACQSIFELPEVMTITVPGDDVYTTSTTTSTYTDIVVAVSTVYSTVQETSTSYETFLEMATAYTTTVVNTIHTTATAQAAASSVVKRDGEVKKRRTCKPQPTTALPTPLFPLASECPSLEEYSSACACIQPTPITVVIPGNTFLFFINEVLTVTSTIESTVTAAVTTVVVEPATTTSTSTLSTQTETATTTTETVTPVPTAPTIFTLKVGDGGGALDFGGTSDAYQLQISSTNTAGQQISLAGAGTTPFLSGNPTFKMYFRLYIGTYGYVFFTTPQYVAASSFFWDTVTCSVNPYTYYLSCVSSGGKTRFLQCGQSANVYMGQQNVLPSGCTEIPIYVSP